MPGDTVTQFGPKSDKTKLKELGGEIGGLLNSDYEGRA
jgi:hypothetical protein